MIQAYINYFHFTTTAQQVVFAFEACERMLVQILGGVDHALQLPALEIADADITNLATHEQFVKNANDLLDMNCVVPTINLQEVNVVCL